MLGFICGIIYGVISVLMMVPLEFPDKTAAMLGAFFNRFGIGFLIGISELPIAPWLRGLIIGILLSLPDAIITKAFAPILILGALGGSIIGFIIGKWGAKLKAAQV